MRSPGILAEDRFYFSTFRGMAYCVDLSGTLIWQTDIGGKNADWNILLDGDRLYMSAYGLYCLNREDGTIIWSVQTGCKTNCSFAADDTCIYHGELGSVLFLDSKTGKLQKEVHVGRKLYRMPVFYNGKLYIGDGDSVINCTEGYMSCYEMQDDYNLKPVFSFQTCGEILTKAVIDGECLYFASGDGYLYCIDSETGEELRKPKKTKGDCRSILVRKGEIVVLSDKGQVECYYK